MGGRLMPPTEEMMDPRYAKAADKSDKWWRNLLENPTTVQFDHRALASSDRLCLSPSTLICCTFCLC
jgi:cytochrome c oxidase assembly protein subunit 15